MRWLQSLADRFAVERFVIARLGDPFLTRWVLVGRRYGGSRHAVYLHRFHRSDHDNALHDHPWGFVSVILAGGYWEHTPGPGGTVRRRWYGPGRVLVRPAAWRHRTEQPAGRECWTLVVRGEKVRDWAFFCLDALGRLTGRAVPWRQFIDNVEAGALGCGREE